MQRCSRINQSGAVLIVVSIVLVIVLLCFTCGVDLGIYMVQKSRLQNMVDAMTEAGASTVSDVLLEHARIHMEEYVIPPSDNPLFYITDTDRSELLFDAQINQAVVKAMDQIAARLPMSDVLINTDYPVNTSTISCADGQVYAGVKASAQLSLPIMFKPFQKLLQRQTWQITTKSVSTIPLCYQ